MKKLLLRILLSASPLTTFTKSIYAAQNPPGGGGGGAGQGVFIDIGQNFSPAQAGNLNSVGDLVTMIVTFLMSIVGALAVIFIIVAGIKFITGAGDDKKMESAKNTLTYAIIGLVVTALAFVIMRIVQYILGSDVGIV